MRSEEGRGIKGRGEEGLSVDLFAVKHRLSSNSPFNHFSMPSASPSIWLLFTMALFVTSAQRHRRTKADMEEIGKRQTDEQREDEHAEALAYLHRFGYLSSPIPTPTDFRNALETFQDMAGLPKTGELNERTKAEMREPRCGNGDVTGRGERTRRFVYISRWEDKVRENELRLKWFLHNYTPDMSREEIRRIVVKAFNLWSSQVEISEMESLSLVFEEAATEAEADITILWAVGEHGDAHKFDGAGAEGSNILAHTFYPNYQFKGTLNGDIHLDDHEKWNGDGRGEGASFPHVLVHEIGHTLGLGHSKKQQAIMFPIYRKEQLDTMQLDVDDKCAINWSYVGASDLCLYMWLLSEVIPKKVAPEKELSSNNFQTFEYPLFKIFPNSVLADDGSASWEEMDARARLHGLAMPECGPGPGGRMRSQLAELLRRRLSFPQELAHDYADVLCQFFDALRREFDLKGTHKLHEVIRLRGVHNFFQSDGSFQALEKALNRDSGSKRPNFDHAFFRQLMAVFFGR